MRIDRLQTVMETLRDPERLKELNFEFNMGFVFSRTSTMPCGCIAGLTNLIFKAEDPRDSDEAAAILDILEDDLGEKLFYPELLSLSYADITPAMAADAIERVINEQPAW